MLKAGYYLPKPALLAELALWLCFSLLEKVSCFAAVLMAA